MAQLIYKAAYYLSQWKHSKNCILSPQYCPVSIVLAFAGFAKWSPLGYPVGFCAVKSQMMN